MTTARLARRSRVVAIAIGVAAVVALAACASSSKSTTSSGGGSSSAASAGSSGGSSSNGQPSTSFSAASVPGVGTVVVDGRGRTVYLLTSGDKTNVPCDDASGCTKVWPDLPLPSGTSSATAGSGLQASLLGTKKLSDGETYPTYNGWLMYEYVGDSGPGQAHGEGIQSFGGTWHAISASGDPVMAGSGSTATTMSSSSGNSYGGY